MVVTGGRPATTSVVQEPWYGTDRHGTVGYVRLSNRVAAAMTSAASCIETALTPGGKSDSRESTGRGTFVQGLRGKFVELKNQR